MIYHNGKSKRGERQNKAVGNAKRVAPLKTRNLQNNKEFRSGVLDTQLEDFKEACRTPTKERN